MLVAMLRTQIVALFDEALAARQRGANADAARAYLELERIDPTEPLWPKSRAECFERDAPLEEFLPALERAAVLYAERGFIVRAIAVYKMILRRAPDHRTALDMLVTLQRNRVIGLDRYRRRSDSRPPSSAARDSASRLASGVVEIPLEPLHEEPPTMGFELDALASAPMFARLSPTSLRNLIEVVQLVELTAGEVLYHNGSPSDSMYVIVDGRVALRAGTPAAPTIAELGAGDVLGVVGLYARIERPITAIALEPTRVLELPRSALEAQGTETFELRDALRELARERMLAVLLAVHPLFTRVRSSSRIALSNRFRLFEVRGGVRLVASGAPVEHLFLVMSGRFEVVGSDNFVVAALGPGTLVGESEFLSRAAAAMPIVATTRSLVLGLSYADFLEITTSDPAFLEEVVREAHAPVWDPTLMS